MKEKLMIFKVALVVLIITGMIIATVPVNATTLGGSQSSNLTYSLEYGENVTSVTIPFSTTEQTGKILTGCLDPEHTNVAVNYGDKGILSNQSTNLSTGVTFDVKSTQLGTESITVITSKKAGVTCDDWTNSGVESYTNIIEVTCAYPTSLQNVVRALNGTMDSQSYDYSNMYVTPSASNLDAILDIKTAYDDLNSLQKDLVDQMISAKSDGKCANYTKLYNNTVDYIETLAKNFIENKEESGLQGETTATRTNYQTIINAESSYKNMSTRVQTKINELLVSDYSSSNYSTLLTNAKAYKFIATYDVDYSDTLTKAMDEKILSSQNDWSTFNSDVKTAVETILGKDYETRMGEVQDHLDKIYADEFVEKYQLENFDLDKFDETTLNEANEQEAKTIIGDAYTEYTTNLNGNAQSKTTSSIGQSFETVKNKAQNYLNALEAKRFIDNNNLEKKFPANITAMDGLAEEELASYKSMADKIVGLADDFAALSSDVQTKVLSRLGITEFEDATVEFNKIIAGAQNYLYDLEAKEFIDNNNLEKKFPANITAMKSLSDEDIARYEGIAQNIVGLADDFAALTSNTVRQKVTDELGTNIEEVIAGAQNYLYNLEAKKFIDNNNLEKKFPANITAMNELTEEELASYKGIAENITKIADKFGKLTSDTVRQKVTDELGTNIEEVIAKAQNYLDNLGAKEFIDKYELRTVFPATIEEVLELSEEEFDYYNNIAAVVLNGKYDGDVGAEYAFEDLPAGAQSKALAELGVTAFKDALNGVQNFIDVLDAKLFVDSNNLVAIVNSEIGKRILNIINISELSDEARTATTINKEIAKNAISEETQKWFNELNENAQRRALEYLEANSYDTIILIAQEYLDETAAQEFFDAYLVGFNDEKIVSGEDAWKASSENVQNKINALIVANGVDSTYPELLQRAKDRLAQIAANQSSKTATNAKVQNAKSPRTGDKVGIAIAVLAVSGLGLVITRRR